MSRAQEPEVGEQVAADRWEATTKAARELGLLGAKDRSLGGRFPRALVEAAKRVTGIEEDTRLLTYALAKVAIEDDFGQRLVRRKGSVPKDILFEG